MQEAEAKLGDLGGRIARIADFSSDLTKLRTQHEMQARQNAEAIVRLRVSCSQRAKQRSRAGGVRAGGGTLRCGGLWLPLRCSCPPTFLPSLFCSACCTEHGAR